MTSFLRHRTLMLVVFAVTAMIGLSSCADTFTGYVELEPDTATEDATAINKAYEAEPQQGRVAPTPSDEMYWPDTATSAAQSQHHAGDASPQPLSPPDSAGARSPVKKPDINQRMYVRY